MTNYLAAVQTPSAERVQRAELRRGATQPVLDQIKLWLEAQHPQVLPRSPIGQAITYARNQWPALCLYVTNGHLSIDNNAAERALRRVAIGRNYAQRAIMPSAASPAA